MIIAIVVLGGEEVLDLAAINEANGVVVATAQLGDFGLDAIGNRGGEAMVAIDQHAPRMVRLIEAYQAGYRPRDWPI